MLVCGEQTLRDLTLTYEVYSFIISYIKPDGESKCEMKIQQRCQQENSLEGHLSPVLLILLSQNKVKDLLDSNNIGYYYRKGKHTRTSNIMTIILLNVLQSFPNT